MKSISVVLVLLLSIFVTSNAQDMSPSHNMMSHSNHKEEVSKKVDIKQTLVAKKGKEIFETMCDKSQRKDFSSQDEAKEFLKTSSICKNLNEEQLDAVSFYLLNSFIANDKSEIIQIPKDAKCSSCGMIVSKYQKWAARITTKDEKTYYFDGVKCMLKFYFNPEKFNKENLEKISVTDYYTIEEIDAKNAYFVLNSDVLGPMGKALIPFKDEAQAKKFMQDHAGEKLLKFEELDKSVLVKK